MFIHSSKFEIHPSLLIPQKPLVDEDKIRTELLKRGINENETDRTIEIIKEIVSHSTLFGQSIAYNAEGMSYLRKNQKMPLTLQVYQNGHVYIHFKSKTKQTKDMIASACQKIVYRTINEAGTTCAASVIHEEDDNANITTFNTEKSAHHAFKDCRYILQCFAASSYEAKNADKKKYSLISEYCDGKATQEFLDQLAPKARWEFFLNILEGVKEMHDKGYSHFDLRSDNILYKKVNGRYEPRIIDFGVMHLMNELITHEVRGAFIPPEYLTQDNFPLKVTEKVDVWALGHYAAWNLLNVIPWLDQKVVIEKRKYSKKYILGADWQQATPGTEEFIPIIKQMLDVNPETRLSMASAIEQIKAKIDKMPSDKEN